MSIPKFRQPKRNFKLKVFTILNLKSCIKVLNSKSLRKFCELSKNLWDLVHIRRQHRVAGHGMRGNATTSHGGGQGQDLPPLTGLAQVFHPVIHGKSMGKWMKMDENAGNHRNIGKIYKFLDVFGRKVPVKKGSTREFNPVQ